MQLQAILTKAHLRIARPSDNLEAVVAFYQAIAAHDAAAARAHLAPDFYAKGFATPAAYQAWAANYLSLTNVTIDSERPVTADTAAQHPGFSDFHEMLVRYDGTLRTPTANESSGQTDRFVVVARHDSASPWLILDIATGP